MTDVSFIAISLVVSDIVVRAIADDDDDDDDGKKDDFRHALR